jgi:hypothetical protein
MHSLVDMVECFPQRGENLRIYSPGLYDAIPWIESPSPFFYIA